MRILKAVGHDVDLNFEKLTYPKLHLYRLECSQSNLDSENLASSQR